MRLLLIELNRLIPYRNLHSTQLSFHCDNLAEVIDAEVRYDSLCRNLAALKYIYEYGFSCFNTFECQPQGKES